VGTESVNPADYVRAIEHHVCQKNDGHLIRIVGPAFETVSRWERDGVPLKVALRGIDRYFERYYRRGARRRPVRVEFCDADVLDVFDQWRRAIGAAGASPAPAASEGRGPSLPAHLERVVLKLSSARATGRLGGEVDAMIDRAAAEIDVARSAARGLRGDARRALLERLSVIDRALLDAVAAALPAAERTRLETEADEELAPFRERMPPEGYERARRAVVDRLVRERARLPVVTFS
jgi:hypothetical protein